MTPSVDELWLASLQRLAARVAHDLKGALNGVSVNLEVVRSRSEKAGATGADVHRFAANAADQMAIVIRMTGALLSLARGTRGPVEVSMVAKQVAGLVDDTSARIQVQVDGGMAAETAAPLSAVRLALAECLQAAAGQQGQVIVRVTGVPSPRIQIRPGTPPTLETGVAEALSAAGIRIDTDGHGISIALPGPPDQGA